MSGKTYLAKTHAGELAKSGWRIIVYDPFFDFDEGDDWPENTVGVTDEESFLDIYYGAKNCAIYIDEAGVSVGLHNTDMNSLATQGRHYGHKVNFIVQRETMISPNVRNNCDTHYVFRTPVKDGFLIADDFAITERKEFSLRVAKQRVGVGEYAIVTRGFDPVFVGAKNEK